MSGPVVRCSGAILVRFARSGVVDTVPQMDAPRVPRTFQQHDRRRPSADSQLLTSHLLITRVPNHRWLPSCLVIRGQTTHMVRTQSADEVRKTRLFTWSNHTALRVISTP